MNFFISPSDLEKWVKSQKPDEAAKKIIGIVGENNEQDIVQTCRAIGSDKNASQVLFNILTKYNITREGKMTDKITKQAQIIGRDAPLYQSMDLRVCPKLPYSVGKGLISTYNCRHGCLDAFTFDDDPHRVYCAEALWRRHIADKFSREFKDKDGKWVGGYINERFQTFKDDGGNQMELAHGERTRLPRPHQYSTESRLSEARGEDLTFHTASAKSLVKLAGVEKIEGDTYKMFDDIIEMKQAGLSDEDIIYKVAEHYNKPITHVASVHKTASTLLSRYSGTVYTMEASDTKKNTKVAQVAQFDFPERSTLITKKDSAIVTVKDNQQRVLRADTPVVMISGGNNPVYHIADGPDAGNNFVLKNPLEAKDVFEPLEDGIQDDADDLGLNDSPMTQQAAETENFPVVAV